MIECFPLKKNVFVVLSFFFSFSVFMLTNVVRLFDCFIFIAEDIFFLFVLIQPHRFERHILINYYYYLFVVWIVE